MRMLKSTRRHQGSGCWQRCRGGGGGRAQGIGTVELVTVPADLSTLAARAIGRTNVVAATFVGAAIQRRQTGRRRAGLRSMMSLHQHLSPSQARSHCCQARCGRARATAQGGQRASSLLHPAVLGRSPSLAPALRSEQSSRSAAVTMMCRAMVWKEDDGTSANAN